MALIPKYKAYITEDKRIVDVRAINISTGKIKYSRAGGGYAYTDVDKCIILEHTGAYDAQGKYIYRYDIVVFNGEEYLVFLERSPAGRRYTLHGVDESNYKRVISDWHSNECLVVHDLYEM